MIIVLSDLHLTDETTSSNVHPGAFTNVLLQDIVSNAVQRNAKEVRIVLLGDIYDLVRTEYWADKVVRHERPWNGTLSPATGTNVIPAVEQHYNTMLKTILKTPASLALSEMVNSVKKLIKKQTSANVYVKLTYIVGNHDRAVNVFPSLQEKIKQQFSKPEVDEVEFLNVLYAPEYALLARHGHEWDEHNHGYTFLTKVLNPSAKINRFDSSCYQVQTIGEAVTAELMGGFIWRVKKRISNPHIVQQLMELNNVRPSTDVFLWIEWFGRSAFKNTSLGDIVIEALRESLDDLLSSDLAKLWDETVTNIIVRGDLTDILSAVRLYIRNKKFDELKRDVNFIRMFEGLFSGSDECVDGASQEWDYTINDEIQYILYGHTHYARHDYFRADTEHNVRMYINTGTYLPLIQRAGDEGFSTSQQMTMAYFYRKDEQAVGDISAKPWMELWNGIRRAV